MKLVVINACVRQGDSRTLKIAEPVIQALAEHYETVRYDLPEMEGIVPLTPALFAAYPLYQLWLSVWIAELGGGVFWRTLAALPVGAAALVAVAALLFWVDGKAGVNERG